MSTQKWRASGGYLSIEDFIETKYGIDPTSEEFLNPKALKPNCINHLKEAAVITWLNITQGNPIYVVGDYDADGITSTAILVKLILAFSGNVKSIIPKRFTDGYGISKKLIASIENSLIITVDNGIVANEAIQEARNHGNTVIVLDHHLPGETLPPADVIVDPHMVGDTSGYKDYCGAGLAYKLAEFICIGQDREIVSKLFTDITVLSMIGTIADVMPLTGDNRRIVKSGLQILNTSASFERLSCGIKSILNLASAPYNETSIGFTIGPILNAPGRLYDAGSTSSLKALLTTDQDEADVFAQKMKDINDKRKALVKEWSARCEIEGNKQAESNGIIVVYETEMPDGIAGIIAGKLVEKYHRPTFVFARSKHTNEDGTVSYIAKGSARSFGGFDLSSVLNDPDVQKNTVSCGGHAGAAGLSATDEMFPKLRNAIFAIGKKLPVNTENFIYYDLDIKAYQLPEVIATLKKYAPFGEEVRAPVFCIRDFACSPKYENDANSYYQTMGEDKSHIKLNSIIPIANGSYGVTAVGFGMANLYSNLGCPQNVNVVGTIGENSFKGSSTPQIQMLDFDKA